VQYDKVGRGVGVGVELNPPFVRPERADEYARALATISDAYSESVAWLRDREPQQAGVDVDSSAAGQQVDGPQLAEGVSYVSYDEMCAVPRWSDITDSCRLIAEQLLAPSAELSVGMTLGTEIGKLTTLLMDEAAGDECLDILSVRLEVLRAGELLAPEGSHQVEFAINVLMPDGTDLTAWRPQWRERWRDKQTKLWSGLATQTQVALSKPIWSDIQAQAAQLDGRPARAAPVGVSRRDVSMILNDSDDERVEAQLARWDRSRVRKPEPVGWDPADRRTKLYTPTAIADYAETVEQYLAIGKHRLIQRLTRLARPAIRDR